jgi:4-hydroxybenzoate polyprenyltransferase
MVASRGIPPYRLTALALVTTLLIGASVYIYNDLIDAEMDSISPKNEVRPLASGLVQKSYAMLTIVTSASAGLLLAYMINIQTFLVSFAWFILFSMYSYPGIRLKNMFLIKEVVVASAWPFCSLIGSLAVTGAVSIPALFSGLLFGTFIFLVQPALVDSLDLYQDSLYGVNSLARMLSWRRRVQMLTLGALVIMTVTPLTYARMGFNIILPISVVAFSLVLLRWGIYPLARGFELQSVMRSRRIMYVYFLGLQVILIVSSMRLLSGLF